MTNDIILKAEQVVADGDFHDLRFAGEGLFKKVYWLTDDVVLKVINVPAVGEERGSFSFDLEWALYVWAYRNGYGNWFPDTMWIEINGRHAIIQEAVIPVEESEDYTVYDEDPTPPELYDIMRNELGIDDLHCGNVGHTVKGGRAVCLDWGADWRSWHPGSAQIQCLEALADSQPIP